MGYIEGMSRSQILLLPEAVEDYVGADNPVRFIDAFVDELDLEKAGFERAMPKATGRPGYHPADLLKLYIYGYLNRVRSSRRLESETHRNIEVMWLMKRLKPDFKTIADFRRSNRAAFKQVFREFVALCRQLNLFGCEIVAVDGTRIKAVNNKNRNFTKASLNKLIEQSDERLAKYLAQLDAGDADETGTSGGGHADDLNAKISNIRQKRERLHGYLSELEESGEKQLSLTDPDARAMARMTKVGVGYNIQVAVDAKYKLIAEQEVYNQVLDYGLLTDTANAAKENLGLASIDVVADRGYFQAEDISACEQAGMTPYVPKPDRGPAKREGLFPKEVFTYDEATDQYTCPNDEKLRRRGEDRSGKIVVIHYYISPKFCKDCPLKTKCTTSQSRNLTRYSNEAVLEQMAARIKARPELLNIRRETVEHPFGTIKQWMNQGAFLMRRIDNVRGEFSLTALVYNLRRAINLIGVNGLIAAVKA